MLSLIKQFNNHTGIFEKIVKAITPYNNVKDLTIEKLSKNHPKLWTELTKEANATLSDVLTVTKFLIFIKQFLKDNNSKPPKEQMYDEFLKKLQHEVCKYFYDCNRTTLLE